MSVFNRLNPAPLFRGSWKGLRNRDASGNSAADLVTRLVTYGVPIGVAILMIVKKITLVAPIPVLTGMALLSGGLLAVFAQMATLRSRLTDRREDLVEAEEPDRRLVDEAVAHLLTAAYCAVVSAALLVVGMNLSPDGKTVEAPISGIACGLATAVVTLFLIAIPKLYSAYVRLNHVQKDMSGYAK